MKMSLNQKEAMLLDEIREVSKRIKQISDSIAILTHYDADGLAAGATYLRYYAYKNIPLTIRVSDVLNMDVLNEFFDLDVKHYIISDLGSDIKLVIEAANTMKMENKEIYIIDHHKITNGVPNNLPENLIFINPEKYGIDGGSNACTSIISSLITYFASGEGDEYLLQLGVIGGVGDMQLQNEITNINKYFINLAEKRGVISITRDFIFFLNRQLPLYKALTWLYIPYIPKFSGRDDVGLNILERAGIEPHEKITVNDLSEKEREKILNIILEYLTSLEISISTEDLIKTSYDLLKEEAALLSTAEDFMNLLSALGRMGKVGEALLIAAGSRGEILREAERILEERRKLLKEYLEMAIMKREHYFERIILIDLRKEEFNPRFSGSISTILSRSLEFHDKIIVVLCTDEKGNIKLSSRAPKNVVHKGFDLSKVMRAIADKLGGIGGGHNVAAGATLPPHGKIKDLIVDEILKNLEEAQKWKK